MELASKVIRLLEAQFSPVAGLDNWLNPINKSLSKIGFYLEPVGINQDNAFRYKILATQDLVTRIQKNPGDDDDFWETAEDLSANLSANRAILNLSKIPYFRVSPHDKGYVELLTADLKTSGVKKSLTQVAQALKSYWQEHQPMYAMKPSKASSNQAVIRYA